MVSCIIPSRSAQYLRQTVNDLLTKAEGDVEVVVVYDGRWPEPDEMLPDDPRIIQMHHGELHNNYGMRASINAGVLLSSGDYILIIDEQCSVDQGYDVKLVADCADTWVVIPRRKRLDADNWQLIEDGRPDIDYMQVDYPYQRPYDKTCGLHGAEWKRSDRADILIDDIPTMQGSCYFMKRTWWDTVVGPLDDENYGTFTQEAQEVSFKTWFAGGRVVVNKYTWYAHAHKGRGGKGYGFSTEQYRKHMEGTERGRVYCIEHWTSHPRFDWFINEKFPDMVGWPKDWKEQMKVDREKDYSTLKYKPDWYENNAKK